LFLKQVKTLNFPNLVKTLKTQNPPKLVTTKARQLNPKTIDPPTTLNNKMVRALLEGPLCSFASQTHHFLFVANTPLLSTMLCLLLKVAECEQP
jgi:hypothetical protein